MRNLQKHVLISVLVITTWQTVLGQDYYFDHYKVENGLSHNTVLSSLQDRHGFLWFGTKDGLNRFDGYTFRLFQNEPSATNGLKGNYIESLHEFLDTLWVGTDNGLFRYDERLENFSVLDSTSNRQIFDIENDGQGNLWYIAENTVNKYDPTTKIRENYPNEDFFNGVDILSTTNEEIWVASNSDLYKYDAANNSFKKFRLDVNADLKRPLRINKLFELDSNTILIGTQNHGIIGFDIAEKRVKAMTPLTTTPFYVRDFALRGKNELWVATESGLHIYDLETKSYINLKKDYNDPYAVSDNAIYTLTVDDNAGVWVGTYFGGVNFHAQQNTPFKKYFPKTSQNSIIGNAVRRIQPDNFGNIWIGTEDAGLSKYNPDTDTFFDYSSKENGGILCHYNIHGVLPKDDKIWIGMFDNGLDVLDTSTNTIVKHYGVGGPSNLISNFVFDLYETKAKQLFVITTSGIQIYNSSDDTFHTVDYFPEHNFYTSFLEDDSGVQWAGTYSKGLYSYNPKTKESDVYKYEKTNREGLSHNHVNGIFQDSKNNLWVTTENGLNLFDTKKKSFRTFTTKDRFPSNVFYSLLEDDSGILWITTSKGLVAFDRDNNEINVYTKANGLLSDQFNYNSAFKDEQGRMYFGSVNGMIRLDPSKFIQDNQHPPLFFTGLQINGEKVNVAKHNSALQRSITFTDELTLEHSQSSFAIDFAALGYTAPKTTKYRYQMEGLNDQWINLEKKNGVSFTEMPAGHYTLKVQSLSNNADWSNKAAILRITVLPVFWKSNLAYACYSILIGLLFFLGFKWYHQRIKTNNLHRLKQLNNRKEKEIYQAKIEFFTNVSHEIRTPLTLIKSPLEKVIEKVRAQPGISENLSIIEKNTNRLLDLVNQLLDFRKTETERVDLTFVETNISKLLNDTYDRFSEAIKDKAVDFKLAEITTDIYAFVDAEALKKIVSNLFGNAIKYAETQVQVNLKIVGTAFEMNITNDGNLIPTHLQEKIFEPFYRLKTAENQTGAGIGLALARSLTELHQGTLTLDTSNGNRNSFVLNLPVHQEKEFTLRPKTEKIDTGKSIFSEATLSEDRKTQVLLVEDSEELLDFVSKELKEAYFVFKATNGADALQILKEENIQVVVSDVMMPGMDGFTLCRTIKMNLETSHIPVILLTSKSAMTAKMEGLESGADAYIEKPFSMNHLMVNMANLLANRKKVMDHYSSSPFAHIRSIANTKTDETFIRKLDMIIDENMSDNDLNVETLAEIMHMSRSTLYRKIKDISNLSPNELINIARLKKSAELLKDDRYRIFEVAEIVGYNSTTSFGRNFQKQFQMTPTAYKKTYP